MHDSEFSNDHQHQDPGVRISRRTIIQSSLAGALGVSIGALQVAHAADDRLQADKFFAAWQELTDQLLATENVDEELYIHDLNRLLARLDIHTAPRREKIVYDQDGLQTGSPWSGNKIFMVELTLDPGAKINAHNHPSHAGTSVGLEGMCEYEHFHIDDDAPPAEKGTPNFLIRRSRRGILEFGRMTALSRYNDNVHRFQAGEKGATIVDFLVTVGNSGRSFSHLELSTSPVTDFGDIYEARWKGKPERKKET